MNDVALQPDSPKVDAALTAGLVALNVVLWCLAGQLIMGRPVDVGPHLLVITSALAAVLAATGWLWRWRRELIVVGYVMTVVLGMCGGFLIIAADDPPQYPAPPAPQQLSTVVNWHGREIVDLLGGTVVSPHPSPVRTVPACTAPPDEYGRGGGHGYQIRGTWQVDVPEPDRSARLAMVRDTWTGRGYSVTARDGRWLMAVDHDVTLRIDVTDPYGTLEITVITRCYPQPLPSR
jgi:hypothetical protein